MLPAGPIELQVALCRIDLQRRGSCGGVLRKVANFMSCRKMKLGREDDQLGCNYGDSDAERILA